MKEVAENLFVGADQDCRTVSNDDDWAVVHACKHPCHHQQCGNPSPNHPNYLVYENGPDIYLNMVDMDRKQKHEFMEPMISNALDFIDNHIDSKKVLIHCNQAQSRSPTLAMLYLAKRMSKVSDEDYSLASSELKELYPQFNPGQGIHLYLEDYWSQIQ